MLPRLKLLLMTEIPILRHRPFLQDRRCLNEQIQKEECVRIRQKAAVLGLRPSFPQILEKFDKGRVVQHNTPIARFCAGCGEEMQVCRGSQRLDKLELKLEAVRGHVFVFQSRGARALLCLFLGRYGWVNVHFSREIGVFCTALSLPASSQHSTGKLDYGKP